MTALPSRNWGEWAREVAACVASVPDEVLETAARAILSADLVLTAGNGGSSTLASHMAQAAAKPDLAAGGGRAAVCLTDHVPTLTAHANDGGWAGAFEESARPFLVAPFDPQKVVVVVFSSSGRSENVVRLAHLARDSGAEVVAFTGFEGEPLRSLATVNLHVDSWDYETIEPVHDALLHRVQHHLRRLGRGGASGIKT